MVAVFWPDRVLPSIVFFSDTVGTRFWFCGSLPVIPMRGPHSPATKGSVEAFNV